MGKSSGVLRVNLMLPEWGGVGLERKGSWQEGLLDFIKGVPDSVDRGVVMLIGLLLLLVMLLVLSIVMGMLLSLMGFRINVFWDDDRGRNVCCC